MPKIRGKAKDLKDAAYQLLTGKSEASEPRSVRDATRYVLDQAMADGATRRQAKQALADRLGVVVRTIEKYAAGTQAPRDTAARQSATGLRQAVRETRVTASRREAMSAAAKGAPAVDLPSPVSQIMIDAMVAATGETDFSQESRSRAGAALAGVDNGLTITGDVTVSSDTKERTLTLGKWVPAGAMDHLADLFIQEGPEAIAAEINRLIGAYYVAGMTIGNVSSIYFNTIDDDAT